MTEMQFQMNNWYPLHLGVRRPDLRAAHPQHRRRLLGEGCMFPVEANGMGGGEQRASDGDRTKSQIFDHTFVEFTFEDGTKMYSQGRHCCAAAGVNRQRVRPRLEGHVEDRRTRSRTRLRASKTEPSIKGKGGGHQQEQHDLIEALMRGEVYNEGHYGAMSTFTATSAAKRAIPARSSARANCSSAAGTTARGSTRTPWTRCHRWFSGRMAGTRCRSQVSTIRSRRVRGAAATVDKAVCPSPTKN